MSASLLRHAIHIASILGLYLSGAMLIPAMLDLYYGHTDWQVFATAAFVTNGLSATTFMATRAGPPPFSKKFGFLLVNVLWSTFALIGALPLWMSSLDLDFAQALFESVSAITTTGSTVIVGLDDAPPGVLMWRSLICWLGGVGIVVLGLFIIPYLRVGGMSFFKMESSDTNEKPFARLTTFSRAFFTVYVGITLLCAIGYNLTGMNRFDAINHAMSTVATGGFSTHDASFAYFGSIPLLWTATFFMTLCSLPFSILIVFVARGRLDALRDPQIFVFLAYLTVFALSAAIYHRLTNGVEFHIALAHSFFNFSSILSTAGYMSEDYQLWGPFVVVAAFIATFMGGCSGSTAGGIKAYRFIVLFNAIHSGLRKLIYPAAVYPIRYGRNSLDADTLRAILLFFVTYILLWILGSLTMAALGYDFLTSVSAVITCLSNVGPGLGNIVGPAGNFSSLKDPELYLLSLMMMMGRLEVLTVLVILTPVFWKQ